MARRPVGKLSTSQKLIPKTLDNNTIYRYIINNDISYCIASIPITKKGDIEQCFTVSVGVLPINSRVVQTRVGLLPGCNMRASGTVHIMAPLVITARSVAHVSSGGCSADVAHSAHAVRLVD